MPQKATSGRDPVRKGHGLDAEPRQALLGPPWLAAASSLPLTSGSPRADHGWRLRPADHLGWTVFTLSSGSEDQLGAPLNPQRAHVRVPGGHRGGVPHCPAAPPDTALLHFRLQPTVTLGTRVLGWVSQVPRSSPVLRWGTEVSILVSPLCPAVPRVLCLATGSEAPCLSCLPLPRLP